MKVQTLGWASHIRHFVLGIPQAWSTQYLGLARGCFAGELRELALTEATVQQGINPVGDRADDADAVFGSSSTVVARGNARAKYSCCVHQLNAAPSSKRSCSEVQRTMLREHRSVEVDGHEEAAHVGTPVAKIATRVERSRNRALAGTAGGATCCAMYLRRAASACGAQGNRVSRSGCLRTGCMAWQRHARARHITSDFDLCLMSSTLF